jgi:hypothetical protein
MPETVRDFQICKFKPGNALHRERVRSLCADTGYLGNPIDPVFEDRELFADYLTSYYTDREPESAFLLMVNGEVKGYLLGSRFPVRQKLYDLVLNASLFLRGIIRYPRYNAATRAYVKWIFTDARKEVPEAPKGCAHFHINLLPEARNVATTRALMDAYLRYLHENGEKRVFGQMVTFEGRRSSRMFERYGFKVLNKSRVSKYDGVFNEPVYLCTVVKDLEENSQLYSGSGESSGKGDAG